MTEPQQIDPSWQPPADLLQDKVLLITGAADGIGRALSQACATHKATVVILDRNVKGLESLYDEIVATGLPEPAIYPMDLKGATPADYQELTDVLEKEFGRLDGLVHNAASLGTLTPLLHLEETHWYEVMQINLHAPFHLTKACLPLLQHPDEASIVFNTDRVGRHGKAYWGAYGVSKAGTENLMQLLADELDTNTGIRVNSIDPGPVNTALRALAYPAEDRERLNTPAQVINPFLYLLGPDSKSITGQQFVL